MNESIINENNKIFVYNLVDQRGVFQHKAEAQTKIASVTKIMTVWLALEKNNNPEKKVVFQEEARAGLDGYVVAGISAGTEVSFIDLCYEAMLPSAADAAQMLAIETSGSVENFVKEMNKKVSELGLKNTHFSNVVGMDENNYSSASDMAKILEKALENKTFYEIFTSFEKYLPSLDVKVVKTFEKIPNVLGGKTGFTYEAGKNLASYGEINGEKIIVIDLNEDYNSSKHLENTEKIYKNLLENYTRKEILAQDEELVVLEVKDSFTKEVKFSAETSITKYLEKSFDISTLTKTYTGTEEITREIKNGDYLGKYEIKTGEEVLYAQDLYLNEEIHFHQYWLWNLGVVVIFTTLMTVIVTKYRKNHCKRSRRGR